MEALGGAGLGTCNDTATIIAVVGVVLAVASIVAQRVLLRRSRRPDALQMANRVALLLASVAVILALLHCR